MTMSKNDKTYAVITTSHRGVFAGYLEGEPTKERAVITQGRCCLHWRDTRGFIGLAVNGPNDLCRVSPAAPRLELHDVTSVVTCTDEAREAWEAAPWG
jgi:hypothetical protein